MAKKAEHSIQTMGRVLEVSRLGFHAWQRRRPCQRAREEERLLARIRDIHKANRRVYGSPRIHAELVLTDGERVARKGVERLMRQHGLSGLIRRRRGRTTIRVPGVRVCDDLLERDFTAMAANQRWVADITYLRAWEGWLYLVAAQVPDDDQLVFSGRDGQPWTQAAYQAWRRRAFRRATQAAGLAHARPYDLRHSFASLLLHEGRSVIYVARQLGHDARLTLTRYGHVIDELGDTPRIDAEAAADSAAGRGRFFGSDEEFIAHLESVPPAESK